MGDTILQVDDIQKFYGNKGNLTKAIDHISFSVRKGEFLGIMGASGSGKTTLLNCISTIDTVTSGHIYVEEKDITALHGAQLADFRGKKLGFIFQNFNLLDTLTAYENISLAISIAGAKPSEIEQRIPQIAQALNIQDVLGKYPYQMSGGQQQRVAAARAMVTNPAIVLADEPTGALDSNSSRMLLTMLTELNERLSATILMVTHDAFSASYCNRILFIKDGQVFNELHRGTDTRKEFFTKILEVVSVLGGEQSEHMYLAAHDITISNYAKATEQISVYEADMTYSELFEGQKVKFWPIDEKVPDSKVSVISISDLNRALAMQNKAPITLNDGQYLLNCNYNGTYRYVAAALQSHPEITVGGATLQRAEDNVLQETYVMTSVGNNDRGTLIVPDSVTASLEKDVNALLVQYKPDADSNEVLQKMIPIGLDSTHGYRYAEKNMMYETFYGLDALVSFLCCYIGLVFLLICAALLALKQLTETTDNVYRYGLLQKLGAGHRQINHTLFVQTVVFFAIPLVVAGVYSAFLIGKAMAAVEEFMNIHIATNIGLTIVLFLLVYGSYFLATYLSCKRIVTEQRELEV